MSDALSVRLEKMSEEFSSTEAKGGGFSDLPEGKYFFTVQAAAVTASKKSNKLQIAYTFRVNESNDENVGRLHFTYDGLEGASLAFTKGRLEALGIELDDFDVTELPDHLASLVGVEFAGTVKHKDGFVNVYTNELVEE